MQLLKANPAVKDERLFNTIEEYILKYKLLMPTLVQTVHLLSSICFRQSCFPNDPL